MIIKIMEAMITKRSMINKMISHKYEMVSTFTVETLIS